MEMRYNVNKERADGDGPNGRVKKLMEVNNLW